MYNIAVSSIERVNEGNRDTGTPGEGKFHSWWKRRELRRKFRCSTTQLINVRVQREAGRYSVDNKVTRDERGGMSSGKGEEDEDLGILFRGERGPKLAAWDDWIRTVLTQFPNCCGRQPWHGLPLFTHRQFWQRPEQLHLQQAIGHSRLALNLKNHSINWTNAILLPPHLHILHSYIHCKLLISLYLHTYRFMHAY